MNDNTLYQGETIRIAVRVTDPDTGQPAAGGSASVDLWAPGVDRKTSAAKVTARPMTYQPEARIFVCYLGTDVSWETGKWTYRVTVTSPDVTSEGVLTSIEYSTFTLNA